MKSCRNCRHFVWGHPNSQLKDVCIDCFYKQDGTPSNWEPMKKTRADRIRAMSDEELAAALYHFCDVPFCRNLMECKEMLDQDIDIPDEKCIGCALRWLQEVEP